MKRKNCENCKHYIPHYIYTKLGFSKVDCWSCDKRQKSKTQCELFQPAQSENSEKEITMLNLFLRYENQLRRVCNQILDLCVNSLKLKEEIKEINHFTEDIKKEPFGSIFYL